MPRCAASIRPIEREVLRRGIAVIKQSAADVVLMDLQYAPRVLASPAHAAMEKLITEIAERNRVGLFRRFEIMRHWLSAAPAEAAPGGAAPAISADGLHMTDRSYACLAAGLADAIARNWRQYQAQRAPAARLARLLGPARFGCTARSRKPSRRRPVARLGGYDRTRRQRAWRAFGRRTAR